MVEPPGSAEELVRANSRETGIGNLVQTQQTNTNRDLGVSIAAAQLVWMQSELAER
jgi:hypothetical protein